VTDLFEQPAAVDEWAEARKAAGQNAIVFKHIDRIKGQECFVEIPRTETNVAKGLDLYDGATVTYMSNQPAVAETNIELAADHAGAPA
jgi:hypothetical protein